MINDLKERRKRLLQQNKYIYQELLTIDRKLKSERPGLWKLDLFMAELLTDYARSCYFDFKDGKLMPVDVEFYLDEPVDSEPGPALIWMRSRLKDFKDVPGIDVERVEIQHHLIEILEFYRELWDAEYEQEKKKRIATLILY